MQMAAISWKSPAFHHLSSTGIDNGFFYKFILILVSQSHSVFCFLDCMTVIHQKRKIDLKKSSLTCLCGHFIVSYDCRGLGSACFCGLLWWLHSSGEQSSWGFGGTCGKRFWCRMWGYMRVACGRNSGLDWLCCCWNICPKAWTKKSWDVLKMTLNVLIMIA